MVTHTKNDYNVKIFRIYVAYLTKRLGWSQQKVDELFELCGSDPSILTFEDTWLDQSFADTFYKNVVNLTGDKDIAYKVGRFSIDEQAKGIIGRMVSGFLSPDIAYKNIESIGSQYSKSSKVEALKIGNSNALIRSTVMPGCSEKKYQCENRIGMLESVPTLFGLPHAVVNHPHCIHKGDDYCEYEVSWVEPGAKYISIFSFAMFAASFAAGLSYSFHPALSFFMAIGFASGAYAIMNYRRNQQLRFALNDQIEALSISAKTLERRHKESVLINEINGLMIQMMPLHQLCDVAAKAIHDKMGYERVTIFLVDPGNNILQTAAFTGVMPKDAQKLAQAEFNITPDNKDGFLINVVNTKQPLYVKNVDDGVNKLSKRSKRLIKELGVKSFIAVPIIFEDAVLGVIAADNVTPSEFLTRNDLELLSSVASPIAVSISNAMTFEALQQSKEVLEQRVQERTLELRKARDDAIRANEAKSLFLANMSHELRTPLNAILGFAKLLMFQATEDKLEQYAKDAMKIEQGGEHLLSLINDILDLSKIEAGKMELHYEEFDIVKMLESIQVIAEPLAEKNNNTFEISVKQDIGKMYADETKIRQIIINLLGNACKFTHNGTVKLEADFDPQSDCVLFHIIDTGIGIPEDKLGKLFQDFVQVDSSTTKKYGGTGLGLSLSKRFAEMMGGDIKVTSQPNMGSKFTVFVKRNYEHTDVRLIADNDTTT